VQSKMSMRIEKRIAIGLLALMSINAYLFGGISGKIAGRVVDKENGQALFGCNVIIEKSNMGAATSENGNYFILNVAPGSYTVTFSMIGYQSVKISGVTVSSDLTRKLDVEMSMQVLDGEVVTVIATRSMIRKDLTASTAIVGVEELKQLPISELNEAIEMQAGFVNGSLRGGRVGEVAYMIDGIPVTDAFNREATVNVNKNMVQELQVISGAFNAEYGNVMSGVVNIVTRSGSNQFGGSLECYTGGHLSTHSSTFPHIDHFDPAAIVNFEGNLFGPIVKDHLFFYLNYRKNQNDGWIFGKRRFLPGAVAYYDSSNTMVLYDSSAMRGDDQWISMNSTEQNYFQGQLVYRTSAKSSLSYRYFYDDIQQQEYESGDHMFYYNPEGRAPTQITGLTHIAKFQKQLSSNSYFDIAYSYNDRSYTRRLSAQSTNTDSSIYVHPYYLTQFAYQFHVGGTENAHYLRQSGSHLLKFSLTSQANSHHQIKVGAEYKQNRIKIREFELRPTPGENYVDFTTELPETFSPFIHPITYPESTIFSSFAKRNPVELSAYIQDKIEFNELVINIGVRWDYFEPDGVVLSDPTDPDIYNPIRPQNIYHDLNGNGYQDADEPVVSINERRQYWYRKATVKQKFSPRIGFSFPISDQGVFHFSYGHFFQIPNYEHLYRNPEFQLGGGTGNTGIIGNANLNPEKTIAGEIGLQQQLTPNFSMDVTIFLKDIRNLTGTRSEEIDVFGNFARYSRLMNSDFGVVKGITLALNQRDPKGWFANMDYTFQIVKGTASDPDAYRNAVAGGAQPEIQMNPLDWDQRHTVNATLGYNSVQGYGLNLIGRFGSGLPYTPRLSEDITSLLTNSEKKPETFNLDLHGYWQLKIFRYEPELFIRIKNVLDRKNELTVFNDTGRAGFTSEINRVKANNVPTPMNSIEQYFLDPGYYSEARRIEIGLRINL